MIKILFIDKDGNDLAFKWIDNSMPIPSTGDLVSFSETTYEVKARQIDYTGNTKETRLTTIILVVKEK